MDLNIKESLKRLTIKKVIFIFLLWINIFAVLYTIIPLHCDSKLVDTSGKELSGYFNSLYYSFVITTTLGTSEMIPTNIFKLLTVLEVIGGIIIAGIAVNIIYSLPAKRVRQALKYSKGWWIEEIKFSETRKIYSFTLFYQDANSLKKRGFNYYPNGAMHGTNYNGEIIAEHFPVLMSRYENDSFSTDYTNGIYEFEFQKSLKGKYFEYRGGCYDKKHGRRDEIYAKKINDRRMLRKFDDTPLSNEDMKAMIKVLFRDEI